MADFSVDFDIPASRRGVVDNPSVSVLTERPRQGVLVGTVSGPLDMATVRGFAQYLRELVASSSRVVVLDLTAVSFLGVDAIKVLAQEDLRAHIAGKRLSLVTGVRAVDRPLEVLGLAGRFTYGSRPVFETPPADNAAGQDGQVLIPASRAPAPAEQSPALSGWAAAKETC